MLSIALLIFASIQSPPNCFCAVLFNRVEEGAVLITGLTQSDPYANNPHENDANTSPLEISPSSPSDAAVTKPSLSSSSLIIRRNESSRKYLYTTEPGILIRAHSAFNDDDPEQPIEFKLTTEKLAYILIGSCCGLSILCLVIVAASLRCREHYQHHRDNNNEKKGWPPTPPEHPRIYDTPNPYGPIKPSPYHFTFARRARRHSDVTVKPPPPHGNCESCRCTCGTWSLGPSNLGPNNSVPLFSSSVGKKVFSHRLPFGTASALHFSNANASFAYSIPRSCHCGIFRGNAYKSEDSTSTASSSTYDPDFHPQCTCIEPPRRLMEWDVSPDSLDTSEETDGPSWQACSYLVDTLHRHHREPAQHHSYGGGHKRHSAQTNKSSSGGGGPRSGNTQTRWTNVTTNPLRAMQSNHNNNNNNNGCSDNPNGTATRGVSWTSNSERLI